MQFWSKLNAHPKCCIFRLKIPKWPANASAVSQYYTVPLLDDYRGAEKSGAGGKLLLPEHTREEFSVASAGRRGTTQSGRESLQAGFPLRCWSRSRKSRPRGKLSVKRTAARF
ncbi:hypothetical protein KCP69_13175 [Salmonella enterica subsp. enterica]|nr:hypothetical protein KCP69_13175 [Salmonella enterica subsp. enterica]